MKKVPPHAIADITSQLRMNNFYGSLKLLVPQKLPVKLPGVGSRQMRRHSTKAYVRLLDIHDRFSRPTGRGR